MQAHAERRVRHRASEPTLRDREKVHLLGSAARLNHHTAKLAERARSVRHLRGHCFHFFVALVQRGGLLELECICRSSPFRGYALQETPAPRAQEIANGNSLFRIALVGAALVAGREALLHLGIKAAGKGWIGVEVFRAAAQQEQVEHFLQVAFCRSLRGKRTNRFILWQRSSE